jgi:hypothetical protein
MSEQHISTSAVGRHLDEETEVTTLAQRYYQEAGRPEGRWLEFWQRAEKEFHEKQMPTEPKAEPHPTPFDEKVEEAMHLDQ